MAALRGKERHFRTHTSDCATVILGHIVPCSFTRFAITAGGHLSNSTSNLRKSLEKYEEDDSFPNKTAKSRPVPREAASPSVPLLHWIPPLVSPNRCHFLPNLKRNVGTGQCKVKRAWYEELSLLCKAYLGALGKTIS